MENYPSIVQIDVTNRCNFSCIMCIRNFWMQELGDMPFDLFKKIANEVFPNVTRVTLYGEGEPLIHPDFIKIVDLTREKLPKNGEIFFSTNGSLLNENVANILVKKIGVDCVAFSLDTLDFSKLRSIRYKAKPDVILRNLEYLSKIKSKGVRDTRLGIEVTLMKSNLEDLPHIVEIASTWDVDFVTVSHLVPYSSLFVNEIIYSTISKQSLEISRDILEEGWNIILRSIYESYSLYYGSSSDLNATSRLKELWRKAREIGTDINPHLLLLQKDKINLIEKVEKIFNKTQEIASAHGIELNLPNTLPDDYSRSCPYASKNATVIRFDGEVAPCLNYLYSHNTFINEHIRFDKNISFGNLKKQNLKEIWNSERYVKFRETLAEMEKNTPWCGNCPFSSTGCWYTKSNNYDCYGNSPSCSECLYSVNIAKCLI